MPAVEIADSIVQSGRETLEKVGGSESHEISYANRKVQAIMVVNSTKKWGAEVFNILLIFESIKLIKIQVVYGDTDSMFMFVITVICRHRKAHCIGVDTCRAKQRKKPFK